MKHFHILSVLFLIIGFGNQAFGQTVILDEQFGDGNFTDAPAWIGGSNYIVNEDQALQLAAPGEENEASISTASDAAYGEWEALIRMDFNPSSRNLSRFYLISDMDVLTDSLHGYYVEVGGSSDEISLYRADGGERTKIIDGQNDMLDAPTVQARIKIQRKTNGEWNLWADSTGGRSYRHIGQAFDNTYLNSSYAGFLSEYTSSRSDKFEYDDVKISKMVAPLQIVDAHFENEKTIEISFNREIGLEKRSSATFSLDDGAYESYQISWPQNNVARILFDDSLSSKEYSLSIDHIKEGENSYGYDFQIPLILFGKYKKGDVLINEFMYAPESGPEYIELINTSSKTLDLTGLKFSDRSGNTATFPEDLIIKSDGFLALTADSTQLKLVFDGVGNIKELNSFPSLNNSGDVIKIATPGGIIVDSLEYNSREWKSSGSSLERKSVTASTLFPENWGESPDEKGGSPGKENTIGEDKIPPSLSGLIVLDTVIKLAFDERLNSRTATDTDNYNFGNRAISKSLFVAPDSIVLYLETPFKNNEEYQLRVSGIEDIFGNEASRIDTSFTYYKISLADSGEVLLNEFSYAPDEGGTEFIELYNNSEKSFNLEHWTLADNRGVKLPISNSRHILPPHSYVVIAPDNTLKSRFTGINLISMSRFPALNNGGDAISIYNFAGEKLDSLTYSTNWGSEKGSLERRSSTVSSIYRENWGEALSSAGSPGYKNGVAADREAPKLVNLSIVNDSAIRLEFSESIEWKSALKVLNYRLEPSISINKIVATGKNITLFLNVPMQSGSTYSLSVVDIRDLFDNVIDETFQTFEYLEMGIADPGDIVINEFSYNPGSNGVADFVEIYNISKKNIDLAGWLIGDSKENSVINGNTIIKAGQFLVVTGSKTFGGSIDNAIYLPDFPSLNNSTADAISISDSDGTIIDSLFYQPNWGKTGHALERKDPLAASNDPSNWGINDSFFRNSAGKQNQKFAEDKTPPKPIFATVRQNKSIEITFNEFVDDTGNSAFLLNGRQLKVLTFDPEKASKILLSPQLNELDPANDRNITIENIRDTKGNLAKRTEIPLAFAPREGSLAINEIMYHPIANPEDQLPDQSEYIEIVNTENFAVSLERIIMRSAPDENGNTHSLTPVNATNRWLEPGEYALIYADEQPNFAKSGLSRFFELQGQAYSALRINRSSLGLASTGEAIIIADSTGSKIDSVFYNQNWHNPNIIDTRGIALERISPDIKGNSKNNWSSSVKHRGGTPLNPNSIYQNNITTDKQIGISLTPNPFTPDNNGNDDHLIIHYELDYQDYMLRAKIYDRYGRLIKTLADGQPAGFRGELIWDGRKDDGSKNRIGIYILVFEAYNSSRGSNRAFKKAVVLARPVS